MIWRHSVLLNKNSSRVSSAVCLLPFQSSGWRMSFSVKLHSSKPAVMSYIKPSPHNECIILKTKLYVCVLLFMSFGVFCVENLCLLRDLSVIFFTSSCDLKFHFSTFSRGCWWIYVKFHTKHRRILCERVMTSYKVKTHNAQYCSAIDC